jgi:hypothetical protein
LGFGLTFEIFRTLAYISQTHCSSSGSDSPIYTGDYRPIVPLVAFFPFPDVDKAFLRADCLSGLRPRHQSQEKKVRINMLCGHPKINVEIPK